MRKTILLVFAVLLLAAAALTPAALANNGRDSNGDPGNTDNCTSIYQNNSAVGNPNGHACD